MTAAHDTALHQMSAGDLLAAYRSKSVSPVEATRAVLANIRAWEPHLHATYALEADEALAQAEASQARWLKGAPLGPLDGVPVAWKDLFDLAGTTTTAGSDIYRTAPPASADAAVVRNLAGAGLVSLGKVNLSEFAY